MLSKDQRLRILDKIRKMSSIKYPNYQDYMLKVKLYYLNKLTLYIKLFILNQIKFKHAFLLKLRYLVSKIYSKNVEFNLVNLKKMHLNSDIFTQAISLKLKNRDNRLYRVLKSSLSRIIIPEFSKMKEINYVRPDKKEISDKFKSLKINSLSAASSGALSIPWVQQAIAGPKTSSEGSGVAVGPEANRGNKDYLNKLLLNLFPFFPTRTEKTQEVLAYGNFVPLSPLGLGQEKESKSEVKRPVSLRNYILKSLKHKSMFGIRIEAKGRLTRRFTASRSVFKMK